MATSGNCIARGCGVSLRTHQTRVNESVPFGRRYCDRCQDKRAAERAAQGLDFVIVEQRA